MSDSPATLQRKLDRQYTIFRGFDDQGFFQELVDYVRLVCNSKLLSGIVKKNFEGERARLRGEADKLSEKASKELWQLIRGLRKDTDGLSDYSRDFENAELYRTGRYSSGDRADAYGRILESVLGKLYLAGRKDITENYAVIKVHSVDDIDVRLKSRLYERFITEVYTGLIQQEQHSIWGAWERLLQLYRLRYAFNELGYKTKREFKECDDLRSQLNDLLNFEVFLEKRPNQTFFKVRYEYDAWRVHTALLEALDTDVAQGSVVHHLFFNSDTGNVRYKQEEHTLGKTSKAYALLSFLSKARGDKWSAEEIRKQAKPDFQFRDDKDVYITLRNLKKNLGAEKGEYFPIEYRRKLYTWPRN